MTAKPGTSPWSAGGSHVEGEMRLGYMFEIRDDRLVCFHVLPSYEAALSAASEGERAE